MWRGEEVAPHKAAALGSAGCDSIDVDVVLMGMMSMMIMMVVT